MMYPTTVQFMEPPLPEYNFLNATMHTLFIRFGYSVRQDVSQTLRSALEAKAKKGGGPTGGRRGKRTMRPGQAKTLSDLPKLSA